MGLHGTRQDTKKLRVIKGKERDERKRERGKEKQRDRVKEH